MDKALTGINGLDTILHGGFPSGSSIIVEGTPGTGKTTLGMQFLVNGALYYNEPGIFITFEELPDQLYEDMLNFGWDLRKLEKENRIRVVCMSPEVFLQQIREPNSILEQMRQQIQWKRMVIDSITLFENLFNHQQERRKTFYSLRNALRKMSVTTLFIQEQSLIVPHHVPFENFVADGVIRLSFKTDMEKYRKRTLEILKMRGTKILEGEHNYRITERGIHLIPALTFIEDKFVMDKKDFTPTGISKLDELLSGGIKNGSAFLLDTNSKANFKNIMVSIFAEQFRAGHKIISMNSSITTLYDFKKNLGLFGIDASEQIVNGNVYFIEHYNRPFPPEYEHAVIDVSDLDNENYRSRLADKLNDVREDSLRRGEKWFFYYDLNTLFSQRGSDFVVRFFAEEVALARAYGITIVALCNFAELDPKVASYLERTSNGVIRTWVDGNYQYLQVTKSPNGRVSEPMIVDRLNQIPYVTLV